MFSRQLDDWNVHPWWNIVLTCDKDEISNMTQEWDKEKSESPTGIKPMTSQTPGGCSVYWATGTHGEQGHELARVMMNISSLSHFHRA